MTLFVPVHFREGGLRKRISEGLLKVVCLFSVRNTKDSVGECFMGLFRDRTILLYGLDVHSQGVQSSHTSLQEVEDGVHSTKFCQNSLRFLYQQYIKRGTVLVWES